MLVCAFVKEWREKGGGRACKKCGCIPERSKTLHSKGQQHQRWKSLADMCLHCLGFLKQSFLQIYAERISLVVLQVSEMLEERSIKMPRQMTKTTTPVVELKLRPSRSKADRGRVK